MSTPCPLLSSSSSQLSSSSSSNEEDAGALDMVARGIIGIITAEETEEPMEEESIIKKGREHGMGSVLLPPALEWILYRDTGCRSFLLSSHDTTSVLIGNNCGAERKKIGCSQHDRRHCCSLVRINETDETDETDDASENNDIIEA
jgi:hypothetical protein